VLSDSDATMIEAFHVVNHVDDATLAKMKGFGVDLEGYSGKTHHEIAIPSLFLIDRTGVVRWAHLMSKATALLSEPPKIEQVPPVRPSRHVIRWLRVPIPSIQSLTTSPAFRKRPRAIPTPAGVPVSTRSPGCSVTRDDSMATCSATPKIIFDVFESCMISSLIHSLSARRCGSEISLRGTIQGPVGHDPSKHLMLIQS
jgi:hypothetical protein